MNRVDGMTYTFSVDVLSDWNEGEVRKKRTGKTVKIGPPHSPFVEENFSISPRRNRISQSFFTNDPF
jgi:hypothetical protein